MQVRTGVVVTTSDKIDFTAHSTIKVVKIKKEEIEIRPSSNRPQDVT